MSRISVTSSAKAILLSACVILAALQVSGCSSRAQRAQSYYEDGINYLAKKDYVKARVELRNALQLKGDMIEAWRALAEIDEHDQNWQALVGSLRKIVELDPKDLTSELKLGRLLLLGGAFNDALKMTETAAKVAPDNADVIALKAAVLLKLKDSAGAVATAQKALAIDPTNAEANTVIAVTKFSQDDPEGALRTLDNIKPADRDEIGIISLKIAIFEHLGNVQQAESLLQRLVTLQPDAPVFRAQLTKFYIDHKRPDDAVKELRSITNANPANVSAEMQLISLLNSVKGPTAAREELVARIKAGGQILPYQIALAKFDFAQGKGPDAIKQLQQLIKGSSSADDVLAARVALAELYLSTNDIPAAEPLIADILHADSRNIDGLRLRASIRIHRRQFDDAIADLRTALNDQPRSPQLLATLAVAYERSGSIELADKAFFDATKASRFAPVYGLNYVAFLRRRGLSEQAERVLGDLASRNPKSVAVLWALAQEKLARQDWAGAHDLAQAIQQLDDKADIADQINGLAFGGQNKISESLASFQDAYDANPGASRPMAALVGLYLQSKEFDKAENFVQSALKVDPKNAEAIVLMGSIQLAKKNAVEAEKYFQEAIKQRPDSVLGYSALAQLYFGQKKIDKALDVVRSGLKMQPKNFGLHLTLAGLLEAKGDFDGAIAENEAMLKDQPGSMVIANNLASLLSDHRTDKASLDEASSLVVLLKSSQLPQFKDTMGWVNYQRRDYAAATRLLEAAASELPNVPLVHYHLGMTYLATGQDIKASEQFKKARDLAPSNVELNKKIDTALAENQKK